MEVTRGDTAAQTVTTRTIVGSAEDAGGHAAPNARQGAEHIPGTPRTGTWPGASPTGAEGFRGGTGTELGHHTGVTTEAALAEAGAVTPPALTGRK